MTAKRRNPLDRYAQDLPVGTVQWIGLRPRRREPLTAVQQTMAVAERGLEGDHRMGKSPGSARQVTLISSEFIDQIEHFTGIDGIDPGQLRRNIVVSGLNLNALRRQRFRVGGAVFEATALCHPCARMDENLGRGGVAAMIGHGGLCARIIESGEIKIGDNVEVIPLESWQ
jgi:MOSC domain-containing protein YiiM